MTTEDSRFARRWASRRVANGLDPAPTAQNPAEPELLTAAMALLSDYEDAIYASSRHSLVPGDQSPASEAAHLVEATRLHADVRRLRLEILDLVDAQP
jgi:hypothetical protein